MGLSPSLAAVKTGQPEYAHGHGRSSRPCLPSTPAFVMVPVRTGHQIDFASLCTPLPAGIAQDADGSGIFCRRLRTTCRSAVGTRDGEIRAFWAFGAFHARMLHHLSGTSCVIWAVGLYPGTCRSPSLPIDPCHRRHCQQSPARDQHQQESCKLFRYCWDNSLRFKPQNECQVHYTSVSPDTSVS